MHRNYGQISFVMIAKLHSPMIGILLCIFCADAWKLEFNAG